MDPILAAAALSVVLGAVIAFVFFKSYLLKQRSNVQAVSAPELHSDPKKTSKPPQHVPKKYHSKPHSHASDKVISLFFLFSYCSLWLCLTKFETDLIYETWSFIYWFYFHYINVIRRKKKLNLLSDCRLAPWVRSINSTVSFDLPQNFAIFCDTARV